MTTGARVRNAYGTYLCQGNSPEKFGLMPHGNTELHDFVFKDSSDGDGHAYH